MGAADGLAGHAGDARVRAVASGLLWVALSGAGACSSKDSMAGPPGDPSDDMPGAGQPALDPQTGGQGAQAGDQGMSAQPPAATGGTGATAMMNPEPMNPAGSDAPEPNEPSGSAEPEPEPDCTPVEWDNPGGVANPEVVFAGEDDGKLFDQKEGMEEYDYVMEEYFFTGSSPAFTSRMVVRRPRDPAKYSGTVFAEWYNVSGGIDFAVMWADSREYFMREGHVFVGISAQAVGANTLKNTEQIADRYAKINHPGDTAADAIFSQAGVALRMQSEMLLGECMPVHTLLAIGQSQSSARLTSYVNSTDPSAQVYDGFLLHSGGEPSSNDPSSPVLAIFTMTEGNRALDDGPNFVKWRVAGATHNGERVTSRGSEAASIIGLDAGEITSCVNPLNRYPSYRVYNAALDWLNRWARDGDKPPSGPPFQMSGSSLALDEHNNVLGGIRTPDIDVPIATYDLDNGPSDPLNVIGYLACGLGGNTVYFDEAELLRLYPTHEDYVDKYTAAADEALANGYILQADYDQAVAQAHAAAIPN